MTQRKVVVYIVTAAIVLPGLAMAESGPPPLRKTEGESGTRIAPADEAANRLRSPKRRARESAGQTGQTNAAVSRLERKKATARPAASVRAPAAPPANDSCLTPEVVQFTNPGDTSGTFDFDNSEATGDGLDHVACADDPVDEFGRIAHDVWYCWTATCGGPVEVSTCEPDSSDIDTKIAVYGGCQPAPGNACPGDERLPPFGCNDDFPPACGLQSSVSFMAYEGQDYLIRIGTYAGLDGVSPEPGGPGKFSITCTELPCTQEISIDTCQPFHRFNASSSDRISSRVADDFTPQVSGTISELCWWGNYLSNLPVDDAFQVRFYLDAGGLPDESSLLAGPFLQANGSLVVSGPKDTAAGVDWPIYEYSADIPAGVPVTAGVCYWIEIANVTAQDVWYWQDGVGGDISQVIDTFVAGSSVYEETEREASDTSFCFNVAAQSCNGSPCDGATGPCCEGLGQPGCEDSECCKKVCACDPGCCDPSLWMWDASCAGGGFGNSGCGAAVLCADYCAGCPDAAGEIHWLDPAGNSLPAAGIVDARQPSPVDDAGVAQGIDTFTAEAPVGAGSTCWSAEECAAAGGRLAIAVDYVIDHGDGTHTIKLERPISPGALAELTYTSDLSTAYTGKYAFLPGDADASRTAEVADIDHLIACLNGGSCPVWATDINRSGGPNAQDLLRLVDVLSGAGVYDAWLGETVPNACQ